MHTPMAVLQSACLHRPDVGRMLLLLFLFLLLLVLLL